MVRAENANAYAESAWIQATLGPSVPNNLNSAFLNASTARLSWSDSTGESQYEIYRWTEDNATVRIATLTADTTQYDVSGLASGSRQWYMVRAVATGGAAAESVWLQVAVPPSGPGGTSLSVGDPTTAADFSFAQQHLQASHIARGAVGSIATSSALGEASSQLDSENASPWYGPMQVAGQSLAHHQESGARERGGVRTAALLELEREDDDCLGLDAVLLGRQPGIDSLTAWELFGHAVW
jgi:hypothetical protein